MSHELFWLVMTTCLTGLMWVPIIVDRIMVRGMMGAMANPSLTDAAQSPWAQRLMAAHLNAVENLVIFAPLVLATQDLNVNLATAGTTFACQLYFYSRLVHVIVYTLGIPVLRTLAFAGGFIGQVMLALALFKLS